MSTVFQYAKDLTPEKRELFELLLKEKKARDSQAHTIPRRTTDADFFPVSFGQQRLWFIDQWEPGNPAYNLLQVLQLRGRLDVDVLQQCLNMIVQRHEALRTVFIAKNGQPFQKILSAQSLELPVTDLAGLAPAHQEDLVRQQAVEAARRPFDLNRGPLLRAALLKLDAEEHVLLLTLHHIVSDGWSNGVLLQEVGTLYAALSAGKSARLAELAIQYADFAVWQRQWLQDEGVLEKQLTYWKQHLKGAPPYLDLPTDYARPAAMTFRGARHYFSLSPELSKALKRLSQQEGVSLFMTLLAAFKALLHRYTTQADILVGSPIANRNRAEIESLIGFFVNTLVLRTDLSGNPTFRELLQRVREVTLAAYTYQDLPFEKLVEEMQLERDLSHSPLFQVVFVLQNAPLPAVQLSELTLSPLEIDSGTAQFDLMLELYEGVEGLRGSFQYNTDLFAADTIARMREHFQTLLTGILADPDRRLWDLPLLTEGELHRIVMEWNATQTDYSREVCLHQLFEAQVERSPQAVAVIGEQQDAEESDGQLSAGSRSFQQLTYHQLNQQANRLAHFLQSQGVGPGVMVAVCLNRSPDMIAALLGILKAGGIYVPLEPTFPPARIQWILASLGIRHIVAHSGAVSALRDLDLPALAHVLCLDATCVVEPASPEATPSTFHLWTGGELSQWPDENLPISTGPGDIAYVIFTSGSTGTPKGVVVRHQPVINLIEWVNHTFSVGPTDRVLFITSLCFDLSVYDIFGLLAAGGSIRVASNQEVREPEQLLRALRTEPITFWDSAPAALQQVAPFFSTAQPDPENRLRLVFLSGDWIPVSLPDRIRETFPTARVISLGGATEATIWSNYYPINAVDPRWISIPYGKPIQNARYYILDPHLNPCPVGIPGDLYIGGECLAWGYANEPALTASKFLPDPFNPAADAYMYRTGDRARFWADGNMEFLGRLDHQVKVRGFRVELGEIETVVNQHPAVQESVIIARESERVAKDKYLVAYVVARFPAPSLVDDLRRHLQAKLPDYMLPAFFVMLDRLPVTPNGKLDRQALPAPERQNFELVSTYVTPRNSVEDTLAGIWTEVLEIERVGVYDNFFELGGHSLLATQVIARLNSIFQVELPLRALFDGPTVAQLAANVEAARAAKQGLTVPPITPVFEVGKDLPLSLAQERLWLIDQLVPGNIAYISTGATRIRGPLDEAVLEQCFNEVIRRHAILRTNFHTLKGQPSQWGRAPEPCQILKVDLRGAPKAGRENQAMQLAIQQARQPFNLNEGPLMRVTLARLDEEEYILALATHHIIYDLMSIGIYLREMRALYEAYSQGNPSPLPQLPVQYADFADWQQRWLRQEIIETQLPYWKRQLQGAQTILELPTDRPRPLMQTFRGARYSLVLSLDVTNALKALSHEEGATVFMTLLAAYNVLLHRYTGQEDIIVGSPIANRGRTEIEGVIGFFVNILALRTDLSGNPTFRELLKRVREVALGAYMHQDLPFAILVEELQPERDLSSNPIFQVMFNFLHNYMMPVPTFMNMELELLRVHAETEQFDLSLDFWERPDGLHGSFDYNIDLFDEATIARMAQHVQRLLASIAANPDQHISDLSLLSDVDRQQLLVEWNETRTVYTHDRCLHQIFEDQAAQTPTAIAVISENESLTYRDLDERANRLARHLRSLGVGPEVPVGICLERSVEMVVGLLGILKAGGAYLPLDPLYPQERLAFILADACAPVLVAQQALQPELGEQTVRVVCLDTDWPVIARESGERIDSGVTPQNLAYIIYTSGSTGKPKGVMLQHQSVVNFTQAANANYRLKPEDRVLQFASITFDASVEEIYPCLTSGATLVLRTDSMLSSAATFVRTCQEWGLTVLDLPTAYWHEIVNSLQTEKLELPDTVRLVIIGGERAMPERLAVWRRQVGDRISLVNTYGPTEATVVATLDWLSETASSDATREVPIGRPLQNVQVYILDRHLQPVPVGVPGEMFIGGAGLARGYLHRPELTAERFVSNPFSQDEDQAGLHPSPLLYRTGDLARFLPEGNIEFLGRIDQQVKIRGFRIELGEIEAALGQHPAVREVVVLARDREGVPGDKRLVAYIVPDQGLAPTASELHSFLKNKLPGYMIPSAFVTLPALPLTNNGKLDRRLLPSPDQARPTLEKDFVAPRNAVEEVVAGIWSELLQVERVGVYDSLFELGGHSLLATRLISQLREIFQVEIPLIRLFRDPTVASLAQWLLQESGEPARIEKTAEMVLRLSQLSDEDVESMVTP